MTDIRWLPGPIIDKWEWQLSGACRDEDPKLFFHPEGERGPTREAREGAAKAICRRCPVIRECAAHALASREPYGVWGGMTESEREQLLGARSSHRLGARLGDAAAGTGRDDESDQSAGTGESAYGESAYGESAETATAC